VAAGKPIACLAWAKNVSGVMLKTPFLLVNIKSS
jgi:hypothetical protein